LASHGVTTSYACGANENLGVGFETTQIMQIRYLLGGKVLGVAFEILVINFELVKNGEGRFTIGTIGNAENRNFGCLKIIG